MNLPTGYIFFRLRFGPLSVSWEADKPLPKGLNLLEALGLLLIALKLTGHAPWPWWAVTAPLWVPGALIGAWLALLSAGELVQGGRGDYALGLVGLPALALTALKALGVLDVSWWWAAAPLWGSAALLAAYVGLSLVLSAARESPLRAALAFLGLLGGLLIGLKLAGHVPWPWWAAAAPLAGAAAAALADPAALRALRRFRADAE